jgi:hypothetical protein
MREEMAVAPPAAPPQGGVEDLARQHRAVRVEVSELRGMIGSCRATQRTDGYRHMLAVLVARLRERLVLHFELEQKRLALPLFADQHAALLDDADRLATLLRSPNAPPDVVAKTMKWLDALAEHEHHEDEYQRP